VLGIVEGIIEQENVSSAECDNGKNFDATSDNGGSFSPLLLTRIRNLQDFIVSRHRQVDSHDVAERSIDGVVG
jgi:hypothetical protein